MNKFEDFVLVATIVIVFLICFGIAGNMDSESAKTLSKPPQYDSAGIKFSAD